MEEENGVKTSLFPKSYMELTIIDELPTADVDSMWILTPFPAPNTKSIFPNGIDTTMTIEILGGEGSIGEYVYWKNGEATRVYEFMECPVYETCQRTIIL